MRILTFHIEKLMYDSDYKLAPTQSLFPRVNIDSSNKKPISNEPSTFPFEELPLDFAEDILSLTKLRPILNLVQTCRSVHTFFNSITNCNDEYILDKQGIRELLEYVLKGEAFKAEKSIAAKRNWLFAKVTAEDYSGRTFFCSPWQGMLGAEDLDMCNMAMPYIEKLPNGHETALIQFNEQFQKDVLNKPNTYDFTPLCKIIAQEQFIDNCLSQGTMAALADFMKNVIPTHVIKTGKHFNLQILIDALHIHNNYHEWNEKQRGLFWDRVILCCLLLLLPACYAQAFCQGYDVNAKNPLIRSLKLNRWDYNGRPGMNYYPIVIFNDSVSHDHFFMEIYSLLSGADLETRIDAARNFFNNLCQAKTSGFAELQLSLCSALPSGKVLASPIEINQQNALQKPVVQIPSQYENLHRKKKQTKISQEHAFVDESLNNSPLPSVHSRQKIKGVATKKNKVKLCSQNSVHLTTKSNREENSCLPINMQILGGFIASLGIVTVAIAFTVLSAGIIPVACIGVATIIVGLGLFAKGCFKASQDSYPDLAIADRQI